MPRLLALEWSESEARFAVASSHGDQVTIDQAFAVNMRPSDLAGAPAPADIGARIGAVLAERKIGRIDTLVAIGRSNIELRQLTLPPVPDEELPEIVRFTAMREFNALEENWPLDYLPIDDAPDQPRNVLAAAIAPELVEQIQRTCHTAGLKPRRLILRPCGAASLFCRQQVEGRPRARLLAELLTDEADLTVIIDRKVIFLRTARLPGDPLTDSDAGQALLAEFRRTMAAVQNQLGGRKVEEIVLCGSGPQHDALAAVIDSRLGVPAVVFDPFAKLTLGEELKQSPPERPGRFAPLVGMLLDELLHAQHGVDFLHPRQRPAPPSKRKYYIGAGVGAAVVLLLLWITTAVWCHNLDLQADELLTTAAGQDKELALLKPDQDAAAAIEEWKAGEPIWLDELRWFVKKLPPAKNLMLAEFNTVVGTRGAEIKKFEGYADDLGTIAQLEKVLRESGRKVEPLSRKDAGKAKIPKDYHWVFDSSIAPAETRPPVSRGEVQVSRGEVQR